MFNWVMAAEGSSEEQPKCGKMNELCSQFKAVCTTKENPKGVGKVPRIRGTAGLTTTSSHRSSICCVSKYRVVPGMQAAAVGGVTVTLTLTAG